MCANDEPAAPLVFLEESQREEESPVEDVEASGCAFEGWQSRRTPRRRETALGLGVAIGLHAVVPVLIVLLGFLFAVPSASEPTFVTVSLVNLPGPGTGAGGSPGSPGAGGAGSQAKIASPKPVAAAAAIPKKVETKPQNVIALPAKPLKHIPRRRRAVIRRRKEKVVRAPAPSLKNFSKPVHHRVAVAGEPPDAPAAAPSGDSLAQSVPASGAGAGVNNGSAGGGFLPGSGGGAGGGGSGLGTGSGGNGPAKVDKPPVPITRVEPEYPDEARQLGISGRVVLKFLVEADGRVSRASIISARPVGVFNQSALKAIVEWRFKPGLYRGKTVAAWVELPVSFHLSR